jgi:hypothetical protein
MERPLRKAAIRPGKTRGCLPVHRAIASQPTKRHKRPFIYLPVVVTHPLERGTVGTDADRATDEGFRASAVAPKNAKRLSPIHSSISAMDPSLGKQSSGPS